MQEGTSNYSVNTWLEEPITTGILREGQAMGHLEKSYEGVFDGHSSVEMLLFQGSREGRRVLGTNIELHGGYVAQEVFEGTLFGKTGTFVVQHGGYQDGLNPTVYGVIVPGSGTGELKGVTGTFKNPHDSSHAGYVIFECELPNEAGSTAESIAAQSSQV